MTPCFASGANSLRDAKKDISLAAFQQIKNIVPHAFMHAFANIIWVCLIMFIVAFSRATK